MRGKNEECGENVAERRYDFMNRDEKLLECVAREGLAGEEFREVQSFSKTRPIGFSDIHTWIEQRDYAKHKEHLKKWLHSWRMDTLTGFVDVTHCLGLNDTFWVKLSDSDLSWETVNLYRNPFMDVAQHTAFDTGLHGLQLSSTSPEFTAEGSYAKCWIRQDNTIRLYKQGAAGAVNVGLEPYAEHMASAIGHTLFGDKVLSYDLAMFKGRLCSVCELFTSEEKGFVPFYRFLSPGKIYTLENILDICRELGFEEEFRRMILLDSIVFNQDRHTGNFGFLVDNETQKIEAFAPLFDFNVSMLCNAMPDDLRHFEQYEKEFMVGHKMGGTFAEVGHKILTPELAVMLPGHIELPRHPRYTMSEERMELLQKVFDANYEAVLYGR